jgi:hypothetical protein
MVKPVYPPYNFVAGGIIISLGARKPTYLPGVYNTAKIGYGFLYA